MQGFPSTQRGILCALHGAAVHCWHHPRLDVRCHCEAECSQRPSKILQGLVAASRGSRLAPHTFWHGDSSAVGTEQRIAGNDFLRHPMCCPDAQIVQTVHVHSAAEERQGQSVLLAALACARRCPIFARSVRVDLMTQSGCRGAEGSFGLARSLGLRAVVSDIRDVCPRGADKEQHNHPDDHSKDPLQLHRVLHIRPSHRHRERAAQRARRRTASPARRRVRAQPRMQPVPRFGLVEENAYSVIRTFANEQVTKAP